MLLRLRPKRRSDSVLHRRRVSRTTMVQSVLHHPPSSILRKVRIANATCSSYETWVNPSSIVKIHSASFNGLPTNTGGSFRIFRSVYVWATKYFTARTVVFCGAWVPWKALYPMITTKNSMLATIANRMTRSSEVASILCYQCNNRFTEPAWNSKTVKVMQHNFNK